MNFDNQGVVSGTFLRQRWVILLVYRAVYFTQKYEMLSVLLWDTPLPLKNIQIMQKLAVLLQKAIEKLFIYFFRKIMTSQFCPFVQL